MTLMGITGGAQNFRAGHKETEVRFQGDILGLNRCPKTRPAGARVKFFLRAKEWRIAADTTVDAYFMIVGVRAGKRPFGAPFAGDLELRGSEQFFPFSFGFANFGNHGDWEWHLY